MGFLSGLFGGGGGSSSSTSTTVNTTVEVNPDIFNQIDFSALKQPLDNLVAALGSSADKQASAITRAADQSLAAAETSATAILAGAALQAQAARDANNTPEDQALKRWQMLAAAATISVAAYTVFFKRH